MNKITPEHLSRGAIVYIRQSTQGQVANNLESKKTRSMLARIAGGRSTHRVRIEEGRKRITHGHRRTRAEWRVFIADHHEKYIPWEQYERNQRVMATTQIARV